MDDKDTHRTETSVNLGAGDNVPLKPIELHRGELFADRYYILSKLGSGGMGAVFKARDIVVDRQVAIKILAPHVALDESSLMRLQEEARSFARLSHTNLIRLHDFNINRDGLPFLVTEYVYGVTLDDILSVQKKLSSYQCARLMTGVAKGLAHAHDFEIVHRDLKPSNCMMTLHEVFKLKILDFGIAQRSYKTTGDETERSAVTGTMHYMSPEQLNSLKIDTRSDQYSLGCMIYECLIGEPPLVGANWMITKYLRDTKTPDLSQAPEEFVPILNRLLQLEPNARYHDMAQVAKVLAPLGGLKS